MTNHLTIINSSMFAPSNFSNTRFVLSKQIPYICAVVFRKQLWYEKSYVYIDVCVFRCINDILPDDIYGGRQCISCGG